MKVYGINKEERQRAEQERPEKERRQREEAFRRYQEERRREEEERRQSEINAVPPGRLRFAFADNPAYGMYYDN